VEKDVALADNQRTILAGHFRLAVLKMLGQPSLADRVLVALLA